RNLCGRGDCLTDQHRPSEYQVMAQVERVLAWYPHPDQLREQRRQEHAVDHAATELGRCGVGWVDMQWTEVAAERGERSDIVGDEGSLQAVGLAHLDVAEHELRGRRGLLVHLSAHGTD